MTQSNENRITRAATAVIAVLALITSAPATSAPAGAQPPMWNGLVVAPESRCSPYDSDDYEYIQSVKDRIIERLGGVYGPYTGRWFESKHDTDIEHVVALSEAHDSGLCRADRATRRRFSEEVHNLTLAAPDVNRNQKRDHDAAGWLPPMNRCWFIGRVMWVKHSYGLTIDIDERNALAGVLEECEDLDMDMTERDSVQADPTSGSPTPAIR